MYIYKHTVVTGSSQTDSLSSLPPVLAAFRRKTALFPFKVLLREFLRRHRRDTAFGSERVFSLHRGEIIPAIPRTSTTREYIFYYSGVYIRAVDLAFLFETFLLPRFRFDLIQLAYTIVPFLGSRTISSFGRENVAKYEISRFRPRPRVGGRATGKIRRNAQARLLPFIYHRAVQSFALLYVYI